MPTDYSAYFDFRTLTLKSLRPQRPKPEKVIHSWPASVVLWDDGTKTVVKCHPGDSHYKSIGLLMCCLRKAMRNRRYDHLEHLVKLAAHLLRTPKAMREFATALEMAAEAMELEE